MKRFFKEKINILATALFLIMFVAFVMTGITTRSSMESQALKYTDYIAKGKYKNAYKMTGNNDSISYDDFEALAKTMVYDLAGKDEAITLTGAVQYTDENMDIMTVPVEKLDKKGNVIQSTSVRFRKSDGKWNIIGE